MGMPESSVAVSYSWQQSQWQRLEQLTSADRLPHALLLAGDVGVGKKRFALSFAHYLMCEQPQLGGACGHCRPCGFNRQASHPDLKWLTLEEKSRQIKIDQVRELVSGLDKTAQQGGRKVAIIHPAEAMNTSAANALLKCLEEPAANTVIMLVTDFPSQLLATIRSRCQSVHFPVPPRAESLAWLGSQLPSTESAEELLDESANQPLTALDLFQGDRIEKRRDMGRDFIALLSDRVSVLSIAEKWLEYDVSECLSWLSRKLAAMVRYRLAGTADGLAEPWLRVAGQVDVRRLYGLLDEIGQLSGGLNRGANPNHQLLLETLLLDCYKNIRS